MIKGIFKCNKNNMITDIIMVTKDYEHLVNKEINIQDVFGPEVIAIINQSKTHDDIEQQKIDDKIYAISYPFNDLTIVFVVEVCDDEGIYELIAMISAIRELHTKFSDQTYNTMVFEEIQKLNNELVNKNREIAKISHKLKNMNDVLSSRLIKDPLTDLVSRYQYADEIEAAIQKYPDSGAFFVFIDIDNFKSVNDTYGHRTGDQYLIEFANRIKKLPLNNAIRLRISGDEFGLFVYGIDWIDDRYYQMFWRMFQDNVLFPITINQIEMKLEVSLGIAEYKKDATHINQMIDYADFAMYQAKHSGKNRYCLFNKNEYLEHTEK